MKIAVLVSGQMRTADQCWQGIRALWPGATFIVHAVADEDAWKGTLFAPKALVIEPQHEMPERREYSWQMGRGCHGVQRVLKQLWGLRQVWRAFECSGVEADVVVRCRPDILFTVPPEPLEEVPEGIVVPRFCNWWGLNDRFAYGNREAMETYMTRLDFLDEYISMGGIFHPETFLLGTMQYFGIHVGRTDAVFHTLRSDGTTDDPVWLPDCGDTSP